MKNIPNKMVRNEDISDRDFHFAGAGVHPPMTIRAKTVQEAEAILKSSLESNSPPVGAYEVDEKAEAETELTIDEK